MKRVTLGVLIALLLIPMAVTGCGSTKADIVAKNISLQAEQFKVARRIVAINTFTDKYLLEVTGYCSIETASSGLSGAAAITCKTNGGYKKSYVYLGKFVTFTVEQVDPADVSASHYSWLWRPGTIVPDIDANP